MALTVEQRQELDARERRRRPGAKLRRVPVQRLPPSAPLERLLLAIVDELERQTRRALRPALEGLPRTDGVELVERLDADDPRGIIRGLLVSIGRVAESDRFRDDVSRVGRVVDRVVSGQVTRQFEFVLGITPTEDPRQIGNTIDAFVRRNVSLIKSVGADELENVEKLVRAAQREGRSQAALAREIAERFEVSRSRARLIARDQTNKLNSQLTQERYQANGVGSYTWRTSKDERVRGNPSGKWPKGSHWDLEGTVHTWDNPPIVDARRGRREHPGGDYQCRCTAEPNFEDVVEEARRAPPAPEPARRPPPAPRTRSVSSERRRYTVDGELVDDPTIRRDLDEAALPFTEAEDRAAADRGVDLLAAINDPRQTPNHFALAEMQSEARLHARRMIQNANPALRSRDVGRGRSSRAEIGRSDQEGWSFHSSASGHVSFAKTVLEGAASSERARRVSALRVMLHEEAHGYSANRVGVYRGALGEGMEEALTEMIARRTLRRYVGQELEGKIRTPGVGLGGSGRLERWAWQTHGGYAAKLEAIETARGLRWRGELSIGYDLYIESIFRAAARGLRRELTDADVELLELAAVDIRSGAQKTLTAPASQSAAYAKAVAKRLGIDRASFLKDLRDGIRGGYAQQTNINPTTPRGRRRRRRR